MHPDYYAVMGNPIAHSKSPRIHTLFAQQTGQNLRYEAILVPLDGFPQALEQFQKSGGKGLNVTVPFKQEAWMCMDARSERAQHAGAVNTILFREDGSRYGDNTDGIGLVRDLTDNHGVEIKGRHILVVGAGGAVRGVLGPLLAQQPARLVVANRTVEKAIDLAELFGEIGEVKGCGFPDLRGHTFDVIVNGTAASLKGEVPMLPEDILREGGTCYDMMYSDHPTAFVEWGRMRGALRSLDGLGMLVEQAAESFYLWRNVRPETGRVIAALRHNLGD